MYFDPLTPTGWRRLALTLGLLRRSEDWLVWAWRAA